MLASLENEIEFLGYWTPVYEGEGQGAEGSGEGEGEGGIPDTGGAGATGSEGDGSLDLSGITLDPEQQKKLNALIVKEKAKATVKSKKQIESTIAQLKETQKLKGLSEQEKETLEQRIDQMQKSLLTKEQLAAEEKKKLQTQHQQELTNVAKDRDSWKTLYTKSTIERSIMDAAAQHEAFDAEHIIALLGPVTSLEPDENDPAHLVPMVKFRDVNTEGKQVTLDLSVPAAVKRMTEIERHFPLFKSTAKSGLGLNPASATGSGNLNPNQLKDINEYRKNRARVLAS